MVFGIWGRKGPDVTNALVAFQFLDESYPGLHGITNSRVVTVFWCSHSDDLFPVVA